VPESHEIFPLVIDVLFSINIMAAIMEREGASDRRYHQRAAWIGHKRGCASLRTLTLE